MEQNNAPARLDLVAMKKAPNMTPPESTASRGLPVKIFSPPNTQVKKPKDTITEIGICHVM